MVMILTQWFLCTAVLNSAVLYDFYDPCPGVLYPTVLYDPCVQVYSGLYVNEAGDLDDEEFDDLDQPQIVSHFFNLLDPKSRFFNTFYFFKFYFIFYSFLLFYLNSAIG